MSVGVGVGVFGGTFDPPHAGHVIVAQDVREAMGLDRILFVPARIPPHKQDEEVTPATVRFEMLRAAIFGNEAFEISKLELRRQGPSYTVDTLRALRQEAPDRELHLILGTDQLREFGTWREPAEIARLARLVVMARGGLEPREVEPALAVDRAAAEDPGVIVHADLIDDLPMEVTYESVPVTRVDLSSTEIRQRVADGRSIRYLVPEGVRAIIRREGLYR